MRRDRQPSPPPDGPRGGGTFVPELDEVRLNRQQSDVWRVMKDGEWRTLASLARESGHPEASVSARLRDLRKDRYGNHTVERVRRPSQSGLFLYRLIPRTDGFELQITQPTRSPDH